jgi:uncharacterized membrane protein HdeD (DUF308 family)
MDTMTDADVKAAERQLARSWWLFLITGIGWVLVSFIVLGLDAASSATIGYLVGFVLLAAGINEFIAISFADSWKWLHGAVGALFLVAGVMALLEPFQTFGILALLIGWYLLFKGIMDVILSIVERDELHLWGLMLVAGILEMAIGVWAIGYPGRSAWLLMVWVGLGAIIRGITEIVFAFKLRGARA